MGQLSRVAGVIQDAVFRGEGDGLIFVVTDVLVFTLCQT